MAAIYSVVFAHGLQSGVANPIVYTVPVGKVAIVRSVNLYQYGGGASGAGITHSDGARIFQVDNTTVPFGNSGSMRQVFDAGEAIYCYTSGGNWSYCFSGYLLDAP